MTPETLTDAFEPTRLLLQQLLALTPRLTAALLALAVGLVLSRLVGRLTRWLVEKSGLDVLTERVGVSRLLYAIGLQQGFSRISATVMGWAVLIVTLSVVAEMLGLPGVADGLSVLLEFLPRLIAASLILIGGLLAADVLRNIVHQIGSRRADLESPRFVGDAVYYIVATVSFTLAGEHLGLEIGLVNALIQITAAAALFSLGLSFALGGKETFRGIISRHYTQRMLSPGDHIVVGEISGTLLRYGPVSVWLETADGTVVVLPCALLLEQPIHLPPVASDADQLR